MKFVNHEQGTPAWLEWREQGIGASESAALFGKSPYFTKRELWLTKKKIIPAWFIDQGNDYIFDKGHEFEEKMRAEYFAMTGQQFKPVCIQHPEYPFIIASLDGLFGDTSFEAKLVSTEVKNRIAQQGTDGIPEEHFIQMQNQFLASDGDLKKCVYFAHDLTGEAVVVEVFPDVPFMQILKNELIDFDNSLKNNQEPPMTKDDFHFSENVSDFEQLAKLKAEKDEAQAKLDEAEEAYKLKMKEIVSAAPHHNVACASLAVKIKTMEKPGSIKYTDIPEVKALSSEYLAAFRGAASTYLQAWFPKQKAKA